MTDLETFATKLRQIWIDEFAADADGAPCMCCGDPSCPDYDPCLHCKIGDLAKAILGENLWFIGLGESIDAARTRGRDNYRIDTERID